MAKSIYCSCGGFALHVPMSRSSQRFVTSAPWALTRSSGLQGATAFQGTIPNAGIMGMHHTPGRNRLFNTCGGHGCTEFFTHIPTHPREITMTTRWPQGRRSAEAGGDWGTPESTLESQQQHIRAPKNSRLGGAGTLHFCS